MFYRLACFILILILWENNFIALLVLSSHRSGGFFLKASALVAIWPEALKTIKY